MSHLPTAGPYHPRFAAPCADERKPRLRSPHRHACPRAVDANTCRTLGVAAVDGRTAYRAGRLDAPPGLLRAHPGPGGHRLAVLHHHLAADGAEAPCGYLAGLAVE